VSLGGMLRRPATRWTAMRLSADVLSRVLQLLVLVALARRFDEGAFGTMIVGATAGLIAAQLADFGLALVVSADVARRLPGSAGAVGSALRVKLALSALVILGLLLLYPILGGSPAAAGAALIGAALSLDTFIQFSASQLRALSAFRLDWIVTLIPRALTVVAVVPAVLVTGDPLVVGAVWLVASVLAAVLAVAILRSTIAAAAPSMSVTQALMARAWPIGASIVVSMLYTRVAIFLLQGLRGSADVAEYGVALRLLEPMYLIPAAMSAVFYPAYVRALADAPSEASRMVARWTAAVAGLGVAAYVALAVLGLPFIVLFFGPGFASSGELLRLLGLALVPGFVSFLLNQALIARGQARYNLAVMALLLVFSVIANWWAITTFGTWGAAGAAVVVEAALLAALGYRLVHEQTKPAYAA
jgi:O-antigen/teichoic acid export membrane protein